jgi:uncharacterized membrane protein YedE/YeeE
MSYWPVWAGALALAGIAIAHWLLLGRLMAVSGRFTAIVDRIRGRAPAERATPSADLEAALLAATLAEFGADAVAALPQGPAVAISETPKARPPQTPMVHVLFFVGVLLGGVIASVMNGGFAITAGLHTPVLDAAIPSGVGRAAVLMLGGMFVGAGTRMASGCTSGHGLCGVSRFQTGSLLATASFFGAGIVASFAIAALIGGAS